MSESKKEEYPAVVIHDGRPLSLARSGIGRLVTKSDNTPDANLELSIASWIGPVHGVPMRCVVRIDGHIQNGLGLETDDEGFPCGVAKIEYTIGGYRRVAYVDAVGQSAFVCWAESIQVTPVWDRRRIANLVEFFSGSIEQTDPGIAREQHIAAAISVQAGDYGPATARYVEVIPWDNESANAVFSFDVPNGARQIRFNPGNDASGTPGVNIPIILPNAQLTNIIWVNTDPAAALDLSPIAQSVPPADSSPIHVPAGASKVILGYTQDPAVNLLGPFTAEWTYRAD